MSCALDDQALAEQLERFSRIGRHGLWTRRHAGEITVMLDHEVDEALLRETLAIEAGCCPFLGLVWDARTRELTIVSREPDEPILDRIAAALA
jgi:hypothetical protein